MRPRDAGYLLGLLVGEGHFGGDGKQPHVTLRMHVRHRLIFDWLEHTLPGGRLYGPYHHGGRSYYQWMSRGSHLKEVLVPLLLDNIDLLDGHARQRFLDMSARYRLAIGDLREQP